MRIILDLLMENMPISDPKEILVSVHRVITLLNIFVCHQGA